MRVMNLSWCKFALVIVLAAGACSSGSGGNDASAGSGSGSGGSGTTGRGGTTGTAGGGGSGGTTGRGGTTGSGGASGGGGTAGQQPIGSACANSSNCSQADGPAVCCVQISTCVLQSQCQSGTQYVPCTDDASCMKGGWICCKTSSMNYCTKSNGCLAP